HIKFFFFFQAEDGIRDLTVTGVQTCALPILTTLTTPASSRSRSCAGRSPRSTAPTRSPASSTSSPRPPRPGCARKCRAAGTGCRLEERRGGEEGIGRGKREYQDENVLEASDE